jgi:hypothetical protein
MMNRKPDVRQEGERKTRKKSERQETDAKMD